ncbi:phosphotransferase [Microbacterium neungamense]|uniref:phosphotransferase n=1 Tax=Microbacterium neungamense TaxID=2810535 RepID=UPI00217EFE72|nr:phosphotransferase [Microbacterium neungamense]UWF77580.1 phosphotransferase [Microbacterium neungamense]
MRQGAVGHVRIVVRDGRRLVEKRMTDPVRHGTEVRALRALSGSGLPVPEIVAERPGSILMTLRPGRRLDWESAHVGDPLRELARAAWAAGRKDPHSAAALIDAYGAEPAAVRAWYPIHAAELWLWFAEAGPAEYLDRLTAELRAWPD